MTDTKPQPDQADDSDAWRTVQRQHAAKLSAHRRVASTRVAGCVDIDQLRAVTATVLECQPLWCVRPGRFATFGAASYIDAPHNHGAYVNVSRRYNAILLEKFSDFYEAVREGLQRVLGAQVVLAEDMPLPGFHLYQYRTPGLRAAGNAHFDLQWMHALAGELPEATLSFTVPVDLSEGGGSLWFWPLRYQDVYKLATTTIEYALNTTPRIWNYELGGLYLHDGFHLHALGRPDVLVPGGRRITLQGHGVLRRGAWTLYW
jgi:hypothetical protein